MLGFPIRTSADRGLVDGSPQLFAVTHVLHRFLAPRHPPLALCSLEEQRCSCLLCSSQRAPPAPGSCEMHAHLDTPWQRSAVRSCRARGFGRVAGSLKTEEKTRSAVSSSRGGEPTTDDLSRLTHQCTNWELVRTGTAVADQRLNSAP